MNKKMLLMIGMLIIVCLGIGGKMYMDKKRLQEDMIKIVKSNEAKEVFEQGLTNLDPKALTSEGMIQSYEIDLKSIKHNPMGGIIVDLIINDKPNLKVYESLNKNNSSGKLESSGGGNTFELEELLQEQERGD
ncbi:DUF1310 family protein [Carnobacterium divergens]|uniref:DUF1310 family protein n=1 Tax=Carnobacterium divergens TaxID=2748 RepID=UPI00288E0CF7|nr:DUF1310 family protein [Carnobacterium divergens]MDT2012601.1 DUF1310 domain-containing protein [Carnobacterium divergens]